MHWNTFYEECYHFKKQFSLIDFVTSSLLLWWGWHANSSLFNWIIHTCFAVVDKMDHAERPKLKHDKIKAYT